MGLPSHSHKEILVVGWNVRAIPFPRSHRLTKKTVQVGVEGKKIHSGSRTSSFVVWIHEFELACIEMKCHVNLVAVSISSLKTKEPSKVLI
jgi:hypothetical protein